MKHLCHTSLLVLFFVFGFCNRVRAQTETTADSGSSAQYLTLSGGTNAGGQTAQPDEFTGAATYSVAIPVPPARGGITPQLTLTYNSQRRNPNSWVGFGWELEMGSVERIAGSGTVDYYNGQSFEIRFNGQSETLKLETADFDANGEYNLGLASTIQADKYQSKIESAYNIYLHLRNVSDPNNITDEGWVVIDKSGRTYYFGESNNSREETQSCYPWEDDASCIAKHWVSRWLLARVIDNNGNEVTATYTDSKYLEEIVYQDIKISFGVFDANMGGFTGNYFPTYRQGFLDVGLASAELYSILIEENGNRLMRFGFDYEEFTQNGFRYLTQINQYGTTDVTTLPATTFTYFDDADVSFDEYDAEYNASVSVGSKYHSGLIEDTRTQLVDMNGDGLIDKVTKFSGDNTVYVYYNTGGDFEFVSGKSEWADPINADDSCPYASCDGELNSYIAGSGACEGGRSEPCQWLMLMDINGDSLPDRVAVTAIAGNDTQANYTIYFNNGSGWNSSAEVWRDPYTGNYPGVVNGSSSFFMDMNGDGLVDRVARGSSGFSVYYNTGAGFSAIATLWRDPYEAVGSGCFAQLAASDALGSYCTIRDFNGDGLPDRIVRAENIESSTSGALGAGYFVFLNRNGLGWAQPSSSSTINIDGVEVIGFVDPSDEEQGYLNGKHDLMDFNGDGNLDLVVGDTDAGAFTVYYYKGMRYSDGGISQLAAGVTITDPVTDADDEWDASAYLNASHATNNGSLDISAYYVLTLDITGDGLPDRFVIDNRNEDEVTRLWHVYPMRTNVISPTGTPTTWSKQSISQPIGYLKSVTDGAGNQVALEYMPTARPWDYDSNGLPATNRFLPFNMNVVHRLYYTDFTLSGTDSVSEAARHPGMRWTTYDYLGGNLFVRQAVKATSDAADSSVSSAYFAQFNSFHTVTKTVYKAVGETWEAYSSTATFHQAKGDVKSISDAADFANYDQNALSHFALSGRPYKQTVDVLGVAMITETNSFSINADGASRFDCDGTCLPQLSSHQKTVYESASSGAVPRVSSVSYTYDDYGNLTTQVFYDGSGNEITTLTNEYEPSTSFDDHLQIRDRPSIQKKSKGGAIYRQKTFAYDSKGNPTNEYSCLDVACSSAAHESRVFDSQGNLIGATGIDGVSKSFIYDADNLFPEQERITLPSGTTLTTTRQYLRLVGKPNAQYNNENVGKETEHDDFGRPVREYVVDATGNRTLTRSYDYDYRTYTVNGWNDITLLKTTIIQPNTDYFMSSATPALISYSDGAGGLLQQCTYAENGQYRMVQSRTTNGGRTSFQTEPVYVSTCDFESELVSSSRVYTTLTDFQGRVISSESPAGDATSPVGSVAHTYATDPTSTYLVKTTTSVEDGLSKTEVFDDSEKLVELTDVNGSVLAYDYYPSGDLYKVTLNGVEMTRMEYDMLGRKTATIDANLGTWDYVYDSNHRLYKQTDAKNNVIKYTYDAIGRVEKKSYFNNTKVLEEYETYTYDAGDSEHDVVAGELFEIKEYDASDELLRATRFGYNANYRRTEKVTREIADVASFTQTTTYDDYGQMRSITYPGSESLYFTYSRTGSLEQLCNNTDCDTTTGTRYYYIQPTIGYDEFGALQGETFGNGIETQMQYYPQSHRMKKRMVMQGETKLSEREYDYDIYSNITVLSDPLNQKGSGALSETQYDSLGRLTSFMSLGASAASTLTYDAQGNIQTNSVSYGSNSYEYSDASHPHAVTKIGDDEFEYDANGNMINDPDRAMTYNAQNQLTRVTMNNGMVIEYDYDYTGARVSKHVSRTDTYNHVVENTVYYLGDAMEIKESTLILNIFAGSQKVAVKTLGTLDELISISSASLKPVGIDVPHLRVSTVMPYALIGFALFLMTVMRPISAFSPPLRIRGGREGLRVWGRGSYELWVFELYNTWAHFSSAFQDFIFALRYRTACKAISFILVFCFALEYPMLKCHAADGTTSASSTENSFYYVHGDHLGSSHLMTEGSGSGAKHGGIFYKQGELIQRIEYQPFGQEKFVLNPVINSDPSFTGQKYDVESGLYFYKSRYYNPKIARFTQPDTVNPDPGNTQAYNKYAYVANNPLKYVDPSGHSFWGWFKKIAGAFLGALVAVVVAISIINTMGLSLMSAMIAGAAAGASGGIISGAFSGGLQGALMGMLMGAVSGAIMGAAGFGMNQAFGKIGAFAVMSAIGLGLSVAQEGWQGIFTFAAGMLGAFVGGQIKGVNIFDFGEQGGGVRDAAPEKSESVGIGPEGRADASTILSGDNIQSPVGDGWKINSSYGMRNHPIKKVEKMHWGVDLVNPRGGTNGANAYAVTNGTVTTGTISGGGNTITLTATDGTKYTYMHLSGYNVANNQSVSSGQIIGFVGQTGGVTGPHLHFEVSIDGNRVNPADVFSW